MKHLPSIALFAAGLIATSALHADEHDHDHGASASFHLAYGKLATLNTFSVYDLHDDHYHAFTANTGGGGHAQPFLFLSPGGAEASFSIASANFSPFPEELEDNWFPFPATHNFFLMLTGVSDPALTVELTLDGTPQLISVGGAVFLEFDHMQSVHFALDSGATLGDYSATFQVIDQDGTYAASPVFTINLTATPIPEPSATAALAGLGALGLVALRRRPRA